MRVSKKLLLTLCLGPFFPVPAAAYTAVTSPNAYMVENTTGTSPSGTACYEFQTRPTCFAQIQNLTATISSGSIPGGSTQYIQNTGTPTTATQVFSVSSGTVTQLIASTANVTTALLLNGSAGTSGQVLTSNGAGIAPTYQAAPTSKFVSISTAAVTTSSTTAAGTYGATNLKIIKTPASANSQFVIIVSGNGTNANTTTTNCRFTVLRNGSNICGGGGNYCSEVSDSTNISGVNIPVGFMVPDQPATASQITYTVSFASIGGANCIFNTNGQANMALFEYTP